MLIDAQELEKNPDRIEEIEKASLRLVVQAILEFRKAALEIFDAESDHVADIGEDITREALDRMGMSKIDQRLFGKIDFKKARYVFHPEYAVRQALFVDSKAEKISGQGTATLQTSQFSMVVKQIRAEEEINVPGKLPPTIRIGETTFITTTLFVKYNYEEENGKNQLKTITFAAVPNGLLQGRYNPDCKDTIWMAGRDSPRRGEEFRVRLSFSRLKKKAAWRVQKLDMDADTFQWED